MIGRATLPVALEILFTSHSLIAVDVLLRRTPFQM